jgi:hypothetical protein
MASIPSSSEAVVPRLMAAVKKLTADERRDFARKFAAWQLESGEQPGDEATLVKICRARLPATDEQKLKSLIDKSERRALRPTDLAEYRKLVRRAEKLDAARLAALTQLASRWRKPLSAVMEIVGWESGSDGATRHSAGLAKARARPRR